MDLGAVKLVFRLVSVIEYPPSNGGHPVHDLPECGSSGEAVLCPIPIEDPRVAPGGRGHSPRQYRSVPARYSPDSAALHIRSHGGRARSETPSRNRTDG